MMKIFIYCQKYKNDFLLCLFVIFRCPEYENVGENCDFVSDPRDPSCCVMPSCPSSSTSSPSLIPTPAPTGTYVGPGLATGKNL